MIIDVMNTAYDGPNYYEWFLTVALVLIILNSVWALIKDRRARKENPCKGCWAKRNGPYLNCMANDKFRETCQASELIKKEK